MQSIRSVAGPVLLLIGVGCLVAFSLIGSSVDQDGFLKEPFPLLPIGWLLIGVGTPWTIVIAVRRKRTHTQGNRPVGARMRVSR